MMVVMVINGGGGGGGRRDLNMYGWLLRTITWLSCTYELTHLRGVQERVEK